MIDVEKVNRLKQQMLSTLSTRGPSLPIHLAKATGLEPLFASAFLAELLADRKIKTTNLKIGSSYLYLLPGQEPLLEQFSQHLNSREKEAFELIKQNKVLEDSYQTPVIRVALRAIKDFAIPLQVHTENQEQKLFWRYFTTSETEAEALIKKKPKEEQKNAQEEVKEKQIEISLETPKFESSIEIAQKEEKLEEVKEETEKHQEENSEEFPIKVERHLAERKLPMIATLSRKKKEMTGHIRIETSLGEQRFYLIAKDKKRVGEKDILSLVESSKTEKMPILFLTSGTLDKKAEVLLSDWRDIIKVEKLPD